MKKKWDIWLIAGILLTAVGIWIFFAVTKNEGAFVVVSVDGREMGRYPLSEPMEKEFFSEEGSNRLVIAEGTAKITWADCPDKLCVNQRAIRYEGETIICLPHKLVVRISGGEKSDVDAVARIGGEAL